MKKVLALVLAIMMLATTAFAATGELTNPTKEDTTSPRGDWLPGKTIKINDSGIVAADKKLPTPLGYVLSADATGAENELVVKNVNSTNYSITSIKYDDGKNLVDSIKFNDTDDQVEVKLKKDYTNTKKKTLNMTFTLKGKKVGKSKKPADVDIRISGTVGYALDETSLYITDTDDTLKLTDAQEERLYKIVDSGAAYATLEFETADEDTEVEVRVYDGDKLYLYSNTDADDDILKKYADDDADLTFLNFPGEPTFNATATVRFYKEEGTYIYQNKGGKLSAVTVDAASAGSAGQSAGKVKWDDDEGCYILKTRILGDYVFSDVKLDITADAADDTNNGTVTNPDTGANDVVGIATALAAVALVSAAAVSLKK